MALLLVALLYSMASEDWRPGVSGPALVVYCAAGLKPAVFPLAQQFEREHGQKVQLMFGGSGTLLSNIQVARRGDLYIAADQSYIDLAAEKELIVEALPLAWQRPVILVAKGNPKNVRSLEDLQRSDVRLALGNPGAASIGRQTEKLLTHAGIWEQVKMQIERNGVFKPTVSDVANDVKLGAVAAGIVWDATAAQYPELETVPLPLFDAARQQISVAVLLSSRRSTAALRFARYLNSPIGNAVFEKNGFESIGFCPRLGNEGIGVPHESGNENTE
jgi:molybdenum ABC transporter molybdate-binding protein